MASGSDRDAEDALSKLLKMGTVAEYESKFVMLINRVTGISEGLLKAFYISGLNGSTMKIEESLNVTFDETPPPSKTSPLVDDDLDEEEVIREIEKKNLENVVEDETLEIDEIVNIKESRNHPLENNVNEALGDESWIVAMQEELNQFIANDVWELVPQPKNMTIIGTKWVFRNKLDENGIVSRNKARLVAQGYNQQEGIDYDETYAPVARLESIRILLAYACALDFKLFQMDVKSAFLNGFINEEVYVAQPPGFIDFEKPDHVYKLKKALYGLKQAPKAWYDRLKAFLIKHEYKMGMVDNTLFTKKKSSNLIIVQIYVDDIIFGSTCQDMCDEFAKIMHDEFEMSMMDGALTWWNSHVQTIGIDEAYEMPWKDLMKLMIEVYYSRNEIQKLENELWNLYVKGTDIAGYTQRFQELTLLYPRMVPEENDKIKRFIWGLPDNIQGNVTSSKPVRLQDAIRMANGLMDQKVRASFKRQNVAQAVTVGNNEKRGYARSAPYYNKCRLHHKGPCTVKCTNYKKVGHMARDYRTVVAQASRAPVANQRIVTYFRCGGQGHYNSDCPKLKNQNRGNKAANNDARGRAYALGGGDGNPDSNIITGTFLLNNRYAYILFDSGADRSFVSTTFSALIDIPPTALDIRYTVELADRRIAESKTIIRGCTLNLLDHPLITNQMPVELGSFDVIIGMD
ncbi:retrovirus-related pol polyprotein from transposon TNT 1-94 [Tanacetum coccineum]